jgi:hypothetical protein
VAKLATAALWVRIQTSSKNTKWATKAKNVQHTLARKKAAAKHMLSKLLCKLFMAAVRSNDQLCA